MNSAVMQMDTPDQRNTVRDELFLDWDCRTVIALTDHDADSLASLLFHIEVGDPLTASDLFILNRLSIALGQRRVPSKQHQSI